MECFPYISRRLLADDDPRVRKALRDVLYGGGQRLDIDRWGAQGGAGGLVLSAGQSGAGGWC
jgi:hypothetical protein